MRLPVVLAGGGFDDAFDLTVGIWQILLPRLLQEERNRSATGAAGNSARRGRFGSKTKKQLAAEKQQLLRDDLTAHSAWSVLRSATAAPLPGDKSGNQAALPSPRPQMAARSTLRYLQLLLAAAQSGTSTAAAATRR